MREIHHIGIPTAEPKENESYMADAKLYLTEVDDSPNKIEWLRFEEGSPMPELLQKSVHIAYTVPDIKEAMAGKETLLEPFSPAEGLTVAFIVEEGLPIELMEFAA
jgi:catechol 2,3-dioxygenase-like lactoylglutathione lyase family enzyme